VGAWSSDAAAARGAAIRNNFDDYGAFASNWAKAHPGTWAPDGWPADAAWSTAGWPDICSWCGWGDNVPPADYTYGDNVTYQGDEVYYGDDPVATGEQYYQAATQIADSAPPPGSGGDNWMPLGVFSIIQGNESESDRLFQLALSKGGAIGGNYYFATADTTLPVHGWVNKETQRAAWIVGDKKTTVFDIGITSLTKNEAPILVHKGKDATERWMLVHLKKHEKQNQQ
jgi:hypothetical protein